MTDDPTAAEYEEEHEAPPRSVVAGVIVFLIGVLIALVVGTVLTVLAHYGATWLGVSEVALVVSYVGLIAIGAFLFIGSDIRYELEHRRLVEERYQIHRLLAEIPDGPDEAEEEGNGHHRARRSRRSRTKRR
jgi:hypothetical protein